MGNLYDIICYAGAANRISHYAFSILVPFSTALRGGDYEMPGYIYGELMTVGDYPFTGAGSCDVQ